MPAAKSMVKKSQTKPEEIHLPITDVFIASDIPEVCRFCGKTRTNILKVRKDKEFHACPVCKSTYWVVNK